MSTKIKEGYLLKFSAGLMKGWKRKYFVLYQDGNLAFFDQKGGMKTGHVNMKTQCKDLQVGAGIQSRLPKLPTGHTVDWVFSVVTSSKKYLLLANSRQELDSWMQSLNGVRGPVTGGYPTSGYTQNSGYPQNSGGYNAHAPPPYSTHPPQPAPTSLGFEALDLGGPSAQPYPPSLPGYPPQPQGQAYPSPQNPGYPTAPPPQNPGYPPQGATGGSYPQGAPYYPPPQQGYSAYPQTGYPGQYPQGGYPAQAPPAGAYQQYPAGGYQYGQPAQGHKNKSGAGMGGILGGLGGAAAGLGAMKMGRKMGGGMGGLGKHKGLIGGLGGAMLGGYALKKTLGHHDSWSLGSGHSWGSGGSFGSFGSFGSGGS